MYRAFATSTLHDLAIRKRLPDRVVFDGNDVSRQFLLPVPGPAETADQFAERMRGFWKTLPRRSDLSERLALAYTALTQIEEPKAAAYDILEILRKAPAAKREFYESCGIGYAYKRINSALGTTRRGHRKKRKRKGLNKETRQAETIRVQAITFIKRHTNFDALFRDRLRSFRSTYWRDADWYEETEKPYLARVAAFEKLKGPFEWWSAMIVPVTAHFYHEQRRFAKALVYYRKTIEAARRAIMTEDLRHFVVYWMRIGIKLSQRSASVVRMPAYSEPQPIEVRTLRTSMREAASGRCHWER
jgi:hypothetical protein